MIHLVNKDCMCSNMVMGTKQPNKTHSVKTTQTPCQNDHIADLTNVRVNFSLFIKKKKKERNREKGMSERMTKRALLSGISELIKTFTRLSQILLRSKATPFMKCYLCKWYIFIKDH